MKELDLSHLPGVLFYQGDLEIPASKRSYCYCIALQEFPVFTGGEGIQYIKTRLLNSKEAGLFPEEKRFVEKSISSALVPTGRVDVDGRFRMASELGEFGDLGLVRLGRDTKWTVFPDADLLDTFAFRYVDKTEDDALSPLSDESRILCEHVLKEVGQSDTLAAVRASGATDDHKKEVCKRLNKQLWPKWWQFWK